ncbi:MULTISPECIES: hypothetical protein [Phaeobacter]|uniref:hypothetical protein n=1 Tax=Phaeobacter TaxID=302485 RepID=UPI003A8645C1
MDTPKISRLEEALTIELTEVLDRIKELEAEAAALRRQIAKAAAKRQGLEFATRKNSINRVLAENSVLEALRASEKPMKTNDLYKIARQSNSSLKENTFRTYLHRMKKRGAIQNARRVGEWRLVL